MTSRAPAAALAPRSLLRIALVLAAASTLFCLPLFGNLDRWGRQDWDQFTFRYETPRLALLRDHALPTWNPYASGGTALLAHPNSPALSPLYLLVLAIGAPLGLRVQVLVSMAVGAIGLAALARRLGSQVPGSIVGVGTGSTGGAGASASASGAAAGSSGPSSWVSRASGSSSTPWSSRSRCPGDASTARARRLTRSAPTSRA